MLPNVLTFNGENITDKKCIANKLNDHFVNIAGFINKVNFSEASVESFGLHTL